MLAGFLASAVLAATASALTNDQIVSDPQTGLAIGGYDPVAYFTSGQAKPGRAALERTVGGVVWRFDNEGNRAAFVEAPEVYMPRYGGYDPVAIARGRSVPGNPLFFAIVGQKLYLFYDSRAKAQFSESPTRYLADADAQWPQVRAQLSR